MSAAITRADEQWWDEFPAEPSEEFPLTYHKRRCPIQEGYPADACLCKDGPEQ